MTPPAIAALIQSRFPGVQEIPPAQGQTRGDEAYVLAPAASIVQLAEFARDDESLSFDSLSFLTAIDWKTYFEVVYYLVSTLRRHKMVLKVKLENRAAAEIASVTSVWPSADWQEREVFDLMGIRFSGHYNLRRILLPDDWQGHPLLKDYAHKNDRYD